MNINTLTKLTLLNGEILKEPDSKGEVQDVTFKSISVNALLIPVQSDSGVEKLSKFNLAKKIFEGDTVEISIDEIKLIKDTVDKNYAPLVVGQIHELLKV